MQTRLEPDTKRLRMKDGAYLKRSPGSGHKRDVLQRGRKGAKRHKQKGRWLPTALSTRRA
ncbi:MAG: hypothetical protein NVS2B11_15710 [Acetobacteraceae bacterium]